MPGRSTPTPDLPPAAPASSIRYRAAWVLPITAPPLRRGSVEAAGDTVRAVGPESDLDVDLGQVALLPGLVNAHTHLELSWMRGAVPPAARMSAWARALIARRLEAGGDDPAAIAPAVAEARAAGTAAVGDITNTLAAVPALCDSPLAGVIFLEAIRFNAAGAETAAADARRRLAAVVTPPRFRKALAAHAPYSVAPRLFGLLRSALPAGTPFSVHVGESAEELRFLADGRGPWRDLLEELGAWDPDWRAPGVGPVEYLDALGVLGPGLLAVHGGHLRDVELERLARRDCTLVACPRSNAWTGAGDPPLERFYRSGVRVAIGTDSLASAPDLNLFSELAVARALAPAVEARRLLHSATRAGAEALSCADRFGAIEPGMSADLLVVDLPRGVGDVEEYLVSGIRPEQVRWLRDARPETPAAC